ncbi:MFS transporter [Accumulibacter sp.]|jgi:PPP family 3-phenylpropionic acid transporter|uniref:Major facilitator superfamily MFS_1 n=1 Tax=Accumulibacter regalis TaxID=522306 RepID=C7RRR1_ACCRE|nr:MFS transporter [Accumulibacter sp.]MBN8498651.1 MFS transporter [Accumulibacter sp.]MBO3714521.1 MFS transporter [Accumulibacter sp.]
MHSLPYWRLSGYYFFYFAFIGAFSPYFGLYLQSLSFSAWDIGLLMSQMQLMRLCAPYLWGVLADRLAQRVSVVRLAAVLSLIAFSAFFLVKSFPAMLVAMALLAFFWSAALPLVETVTFDHLRDQPGRYSRIRLWGSVGFIVAVMGTGALLDGLHLPSLLWVIVGTLTGILIYALAVPEAPAHASADEHLPVGDIVRQTRVRALFAACFMMSAAHGALYVFYSIHLADHQYNKFLVGCLWSLGVLAEIIVFFFMSDLLRQFGLRAILLLSFAAATVRFLMIGWGVDWLLVIVLAQLLHGLTFGAYHAAAIAAINRWFPGRCQARGQALYSSVSFGAGGLVGGLLSGWTWERLGAAPTYALSSVFALVGLLFVAQWVRRSDLDDVPD